MFKRSVSKKRFPCTDSDFTVMQIRSAENKAQMIYCEVLYLLILNCSLVTTKNANIAFFSCPLSGVNKRGSRKNFGPIWNLGTRFWWVSSPSHFRVTFASRQSQFLLLLFFTDGSWSHGFVVFSFRLVFRRRIFQSLWVQLIELKTVYWWAFASLIPLAFSVVLFSFICTII